MRWKTGLIGAGLTLGCLIGVGRAQQLPEGEGKQLVEDTCARSCHGPESWSELRLSAEDWDPLVRDMSSRGEAKSEADLKKIIAYLAKYFGPEKSSDQSSQTASKSDSNKSDSDKSDSNKSDSDKPKSDSDKPKSDSDKPSQNR